jgi:hypothetical protein
MATIAYNPRSRIAPPMHWPLPDWDFSSSPQGPEWQVLADRFKAIWRQLLSAESFRRVALAAEELTYSRVPPRRSYTVPVRYEFRGRGKPLPYPLDEE